MPPHVAVSVVRLRCAPLVRAECATDILAISSRFQSRLGRDWGVSGATLSCVSASKNFRTPAAEVHGANNRSTPTKQKVHMETPGWVHRLAGRGEQNIASDDEWWRSRDVHAIVKLGRVRSIARGSNHSFHRQVRSFKITGCAENCHGKSQPDVARSDRCEDVSACRLPPTTTKQQPLTTTTTTTTATATKTTTATTTTTTAE